MARTLHERIQVATATAIASHGYQAASVADICAEAHISEKTFHEHFVDKQEAAMSTLETSVDQVMTDLREAFERAPTWPEAIWNTSEAVLEWMVHEPAFTRLALVEMLSAGEAALELLQSLMDAFALFLQPGYELIPDKASSRRLVDETVANAIFGLFNERITREGTTGIETLLPDMVQKILTPFLGAREAAEFVAQRRAQA